MIRLFAGIAVDPIIAARLAPLATGIPGARWVEARNLHITLRFIGEVEDGHAEDIHDALGAIASPSFTLTLETLGTFGHRRPHTLWLGVAREPALERLQAKVEAAVVRAGCPPEPRKFTPHVTLARLGGESAARIPDYIAGNSPFRAGQMQVSQVTLFRSHLSRNGANYEALAEYPLTPTLTTSPQIVRTM